MADNSFTKDREYNVASATRKIRKRVAMTSSMVTTP
jgi:hypothetical protein